MPSNVWLITGCSTGFGRELARVVLQRGGRVVATARNTASLDEFREAGADRALVLPLDVTKPGQVAAAVEKARSAFGRIDVLVNNAGRGYLSAIEEGKDDEVRALFDLNVFGVLATTKAVLPGMRAQRSGCIVNFSSAGGFRGNPGHGYYAATKFAVEGISDSLAAELQPMGIRVLVVEPGPFRTSFFDKDEIRTTTPIDAYAGTTGTRNDGIIAGSGTQVGDPRLAAELIVKAVENPKTLRLVLGSSAIETVRTKLATVLSEIDVWEKESRATEFSK